MARAKIRIFDSGTLWRYEEGREQRGFWWNKGILHQDENAVVEVDLRDSPKRRRQLVQYARNVLTRRFEQEAIYIKFVGSVEAVAVEKVAARRPKDPPRKS